MYVKKELKLNKFVEVALPRNIEYVRRFGKATPGAGQYAEDDEPVSKRTTEVLADMDAFDRQRLADEG